MYWTHKCRGSVCQGVTSTTLRLSLTMCSVDLIVRSGVSGGVGGVGDVVGNVVGDVLA